MYEAAGPGVVDAFERAVLTGLAQPQKVIPARFFYDEAGSALFEAITQLPEYYPTRTEAAILAEQAAAIGCEQRIVMRQSLRRDPAPAGTGHVLAQSKRGIGNAGPPRCCRDRQADRPTLDNRRRPATGGAVETLAAEHDLHRQAA
jgi:hypothetical protein